VLDDRLKLLDEHRSHVALGLGLFKLGDDGLFRLAGARLSSCSIARSRSPDGAAGPLIRTDGKSAAPLRTDGGCTP